MIRDVDVLAHEWADPHVLPDHELAALVGGWDRVVLVGDSTVEGVRGPVPGYRDLSWADRLALAFERARSGTDTINLGRRGLTAAQVRDAQLQRALDLEPDLAIVVAGGNDVLLGLPLDAAAAAMGEMVDALRAGGAEVLTMDLVDDGRGLASFAPLSSAVRALGAWHAPLRDGPLAAERDIYAPDGLHLNARGHAIVATDVGRSLSLRRSPAFRRRP
jgi:lysophospholipase L1-like esterase